MVNGNSVSSLIKLGLTIFLILVIGVLINTAWQALHSMVMEFFPGVAQSEAQRQIAENAAKTAEIKRQAAFDAEWGPRLATIQSVAQLLLWLLVGLIPLLIVLAGFVWAMNRIRMPHSSGLPVSFKWGNETDPVKLAAFQAHLQRLNVVAEKQMVPETWSPTYSPTYDAPAPVQAVIAKPTITELLQLPEFCFGNADDGAVTVEGELKSVGYGGIPGSGKTNTAVFHGIQVITKRDGELWVGDPHFGNNRSLQTYMGPFSRSINMVGPDTREILNLVREFHNEWNIRKKRGQDDWPTRVLVLDEWTELLKGDYAEPLMKMIGDIVRGGSKYRMVTWLLSQEWSVKSTGGGELRNILNWAVAHKMRKAEVGMMTGQIGASVPGDVGDLPTGDAYVFGLPTGMKRIRVPQVTVEELVALPAPPEAGPIPNREQPKLLNNIAKIIEKDSRK